MSFPTSNINPPLSSDHSLRPKVSNPSQLPLTASLLFVYVIAVVLLSAYPGLSLIATVIGLMLAFSFAMETIARRQKLYFPTPIIMFMLFLCFCSFQLLWTPGSPTALFTLLQLLVLTIIVVNYSILARSDFIIELAIYAAVLASLLYFVVFDSERIDGRVASTVGNANEYSLILLLGLMLIMRRLLLILMHRPISLWRFGISVIYLIVSIYAIVYLAGSRMGILLAIGIVAVISLYLIWQQPVRRRIWVTVVVLGVCVSVGYAVYQSPQFSRLVPLAAYFQGETVEDTSILARDQMRKDGLRLWLERPLTGWGLDQYRAVSGWGTYSHDNYAELLANQGLVGLLLYLTIYGSALVSLARTFRQAKDPAVAARAFWGMAALIVVIGADFTIVTYYNKFHWLTLGIIIALGARRGQVHYRPSSLRTVLSDRGSNASHQAENGRADSITTGPEYGERGG